MPTLHRCQWCSDDPLYQEYHDKEWGVPSFDDDHLFEMIMLEGAQAGLSWITVLRKRENYRKAFNQFDPEKMARYTDTKLERLRENPGIIRNKLKIESARRNARAFLTLREQGSSLSDFVWQFVDGRPQQNNFKTLSQVPASTETSDKMSKALKKAGFNFVGSTICYAFMQAAGLVNDHTQDCHRYQPCKKLGIDKP